MQEIYHFHDTKTPENVFRPYSSRQVQDVVDNMYDKLNLSNPPKVNLFKDPGHVYTSYYVCTKTINVSEAALNKLPAYAWKAMIAHEIAHYYDTITNYSLRAESDDKANKYLHANPTEMAADQLAAKLTSPQGVLRALQYCHAFVPSDTDNVRMGAMREIIEKSGLEKSIKNNLLTVFKKQEQKSNVTSSSAPTPTASNEANTETNGGNNKSQAPNADAPNLNENRKSEKNKHQILEDKVLDKITQYVSQHPSSASSAVPTGVSAVKMELERRKHLQEKIKSEVKGMNKKENKKKKNNNLNLNI